VLGPYREGQVRALYRVQKGAAKHANNINESGWETSAQRLIDSLNMRPFHVIHREKGL
jgi:hypothetical protein